MADTKIRTNRLNVATLVKNILDSTTASAIRSLLGLVINTDVASMTLYQTGVACSSPITYTFDSAYDAQQFNVSANITIGGPASGRYTNQIFTLFLTSTSTYSLSHDGTIVASTSHALPATLTANKKMVMRLLYITTYKWLLIDFAEQA